VNYASSGNGSAQHLFTAMFVSAAGLQMVHVPYRGSAQATTDLLGGQVPMGMPGLAAMATHIREGKLRALAVTGERRSPLLPDVPTLAESGFPGYSAYVWNGLVAPKGTPPEAIARVHRELVLALRSPAVKAYADKAAIELISDTPAEFGAFLKQERERMAKAVKDTGASVD
jgi:tripartite-type tricarboxylate transporter receptor subunit TctC